MVIFFIVHHLDGCIRFRNDHFFFFAPAFQAVALPFSSKVFDLHPVPVRDLWQIRQLRDPVHTVPAECQLDDANLIATPAMKEQAAVLEGIGF